MKLIIAHASAKLLKRQLTYRAQCPGCRQFFYTQEARRSKKTFCGLNCYFSYTGLPRSILLATDGKAFIPNAQEPAIVSCSECGKCENDGFTYYPRSESNENSFYNPRYSWPYCYSCYKKRSPDSARVDVRGPSWPKARASALRRDNYTCQHCDLQSRTGLHVHHIKPFRCFENSLLANVPENLITLCGPCHIKAEKQLKSRNLKSHPDFVPAVSVHKNRGKSWSSNRKFTLQRDGYKCQCCFESDKLHVHHVVPKREFQDINAANHPRNLVTLCHSCHVFAEADARKKWPSYPGHGYSKYENYIMLAHSALMRHPGNWWPRAASALLRNHMLKTQGAIKIALRIRRYYDDGTKDYYKVPLCGRPRKGAVDTGNLAPCLPVYPELTAEQKRKIKVALSEAKATLKKDPLRC